MAAENGLKSSLAFRRRERSSFSMIYAAIALALVFAVVAFAWPPLSDYLYERRRRRGRRPKS